MDPNQKLNQLDPKLKEAYERVMGTPVGNAPAAPAAPQAPGTQPPPAAPVATPAQPTNAAPPPPPPQPATTQQMQMAQPSMPIPPAPAGAPQGGMPSTQVNAFGQPIQQPAPAPAATQSAAVAKPGVGSHGFVANKKGMKAFPLILIVGGIIFLLVYTVFWFKFFNIPIPFLNQ